MRQDDFHFFPERPDFIGSAACPDPASRSPNFFGVGLAIAVHAQNWTENRELEPTNHELLEARGLTATAMETADITRPPGDATDSHTKTDLDLLS